MSDSRRARFAALVDEVGEPLRRYLGRRLQAADADDVLGDVLMVLWRRIDDVPADASLPWSYGVARRTLANHRRSARRSLALADRLRSSATPSHVVGDDGDHPELAEALGRLPAPDREVLVLWAWEGLEAADIATVLAISPNAAALRLSRARKRLAATMVTGSADSRTRRGHGNPGGAT